MSCVALCIKLASWMFGHRGRRRRILLLPPHHEHYHRQFSDGDDEIFHEQSPRPIIVLGDNSARQHNGGGLQTSEIELREVPFGSIEDQRRTMDKDHNDAAFEHQRFNRSGTLLKRDTTNTSMMTRTGTPSVNGEHCDVSPGASHGSGESGYGNDGEGDGNGEEDGGDGREEEEQEEEGGGQGEEDAERARVGR